MFATFDEIIGSLARKPRKMRVAVAAAHDREVLEGVVESGRLGLADFILLGDGAKIEAILAELGAKAGDFEIVEKPAVTAAARLAAEMTSDGRADAPMKGLLHTSEFLRPILDKDLGLLGEGALLSQATVAELAGDRFSGDHPAADRLGADRIGGGRRLLVVTDCAINVAPDYGAKIKIAANAIKLAAGLGLSDPRLAVVAAVETVNPAMQETVDAAMISKAAQRGQLKGALVDGPLALDLALSPEAARTKGVDGPVAGRADILLMPNLASANVLDKALRHFGGLRTGAAVIGARVPLIMTSRSDSAGNKLRAVALGALAL
jgi:phosphate butyryltransferase